MPETVETTSPVQDNSDFARSTIDLIGLNFDKLDKDRDNFLTKDELQSAAADPNSPANLQLALEAFAPAVKRVQAISNDEFGRDNDGVTKRDLKLLNQDLPRYKEILGTIEDLRPGQDVTSKRVFGALLNSRFDKIDDDKDGTLSRLEIEHYGNRLDVTDSERTIAGVLLDHFDEFAGITNEGGLKEREKEGPFLGDYSNETNITKHDVETFDSMLARSDKFEQYMKTLRIHEMVEGLTGAVMTGGFATLTGMVAFGNPEPITKTAVGVVSLGLAGMTVKNLGRALVGETQTIRDQYIDRQNMLDSWKFFND